MQIVDTFVQYLYAFHFKGEEFDALEKVFVQWNDPLFLFEFFTENENDLKGEYTVEEAIQKTRIEFKKFRKRMLELAEDNPHRLNEFFANLDNKEYKQTILSRQKAKQNWLRLYALKIDHDVQDYYIVTGGMIKLTQLMEEREHGEIERNRINQCRDYLKSIDVYDVDSFFEICF